MLPSHAEGARSLQPKSSSYLQNRGAESPAGEGAAKATWASGYSNTESSLGQKKPEVRLGSGFPEGETSPEAMNAAESGACFVNTWGSCAT